MITQESRAKTAQAEASPPENIDAAAASPIDAIPSAEMGPLRILVVDDELSTFVFAQVRENEPEIEKTLGDSTSPEVAELLEICRKRMDVTRFDADPGSFDKYLMSDAFVSEVLMDPAFRGQASAGLREKFANFFGRADRGAKLRAEFEKAFESPKYELTFMTTRPKEAEALNFDFMFLDLVLVGSASPVGELKEFLSSLSKSAADNGMPPIVAMSTAEDELKKHRKEFSKASQISAAGLWILPKSDLESADFKARGLSVLFDQLMRQRSAAQSMRAFIRSWAGALASAADSAETTLWNLDASAVQRIHFTAIGDNDPFDGHFGDLISREYLWHFENDSMVSKSMNDLDECFREHLDDGDRMVTRFMTPIVDPEVARTFFSHYVWSGWPTTQQFYGPSVKNPAQKFNSTLPFGSVLASELKAGGECLVHVTQQCDLNSSTRPKPDQRSAIFAIAEVVAALPHVVTRFDNDTLVAMGLKVKGVEYDLKYVPGRVLAMPIPDFLKWAEESKMNIVGRLRLDVASQFAQATASQLTRPAGFKMARESSLTVKAFLYSDAIPQTLRPAVYEQSPGKGKEFSIGRSLDGLLSFPDDDGLRIAVWIERMLAAHFGGGQIDVVALSNKLRMGVKNEGVLLPNLTLDLRHGELKTAFATLKNIQMPKAPAIKLVLVGDESTKAS